MPKIKLHEGLSLQPPELAFASRVFTLAWAKLAIELVAYPDVVSRARDLLARSVLRHIAWPLGEPEVVACRMVHSFKETSAGLCRSAQNERRDWSHLDPNWRACQNTAVLLRESRERIDHIHSGRRKTGEVIDRALALIAAQQESRKK